MDHLHARCRFITLALCCLMYCGCAPRLAPTTQVANHVYTNASVAADHVIASQAGVEMLQQGGNAVDAAVAASFCLSVVRPYSCGIGGGGFMLIYIPAKDGQDQRIVAINYREASPAAVDRDYFSRLNDPIASQFGHHAVAIPGTVAGLSHALQHYGTMKLADVLQPAIRAAEDGFAADAHFVAAAKELASDLEKHPDLMRFAAPIWHDLCLNGNVEVGDIIKQPHKARALRLIAEKGPDAFYKGEIGHAIFATMHTHGGPITMSDLRDYKVEEVQPLVSNFLDYTLISMPPPSSGGIAMQQIFGILQRRWSELTAAPHNDATYTHLIAEAMKHAFADRARHLADPNFADMPIDQLLAPVYLDQLAARITDRTLPPENYGTAAFDNPGNSTIKDDSGTSHFCVIDSTGMAVACTETINLNFGSLVTVPGFGIILNNEMDDFTTIPDQPNAFGLTQSDANLPQPGKRPLSSMSPTFLVKDGRVVLIAGASGGPRIITSTTQAILNHIVFDMSAQDAIVGGRFHHQWMPHILRYEKDAIDQRTLDNLKQRGHQTQLIKGIGEVQMITISTDGIHAASDPRKGGQPAGY